MSVVATYARVNESALEALRGDANWIEALYEGRVENAEIIDLDKACDGIVWLLSRMPRMSTVAVPGCGFILNRSLAPLLSGAGGRKESTLEAPYGPASVLTSQQVRELSSWFNGIEVSQLRALYDPRAMAKSGVYPQIWMEEGAAAFEDYLLPRFSDLRKFIAAAAAAEQCVVVFFT